MICTEVFRGEVYRKYFEMHKVRWIDIWTDRYGYMDIYRTIFL